MVGIGFSQKTIFKKWFPINEHDSKKNPQYGDWPPVIKISVDLRSINSTKFVEYIIAMFEKSVATGIPNIMKPMSVPNNMEMQCPVLFCRKDNFSLESGSNHFVKLYFSWFLNHEIFLNSVEYQKELKNFIRAYLSSVRCFIEKNSCKVKTDQLIRIRRKHQMLSNQYVSVSPINKSVNN